MGGHSSGGLFSGVSSGHGVQPPAFEEPVPAHLRSVRNIVVESNRTGSALKLDPDHAFPDIVDNYAGFATRFFIIGGDGKGRLLLQLEGSLNGNPGVFEWIVDLNPARGVTHRRFIRNGIISGKPNQRVGGN